ncbi:MAG: DUF885 family protein [Gemmatimonadaceae bacterium]
MLHTFLTSSILRYLKIRALFPVRRVPGLSRAVCAPLGLGMLAACALNRVPPPPSPADSTWARTQLNEALTQYWRTVLPHRPDLSAALGRRVDPMPSPVTTLADNSAQQLARRMSDELETINAGALSPRDYATLQTLSWVLETSAEAATYSLLDFSLLSPAHTPLRHAIRVLNDHPFASSGDLDRYLFLLDGLSFWLLDARTALEQRGRQSSFASGDAVRSFSTFLREMRTLGAEGMWRVADGRLTSLDTALVRDFRNQEHESIILRVQPGIDTLLAFLDGYANRATQRPGLWQSPGGKEYYRHLLRRNLGLEIEPEEAHRVGLSEMRRIDSLLSGVRRRILRTGNAPAFHDSLRRSARFAPITVDSALARARAMFALIQDTLANRIAKLPDSGPEIRVASRLESLLAPEAYVRAPELVNSAALLALTPYWSSRDGVFEGRSLAFRWNWPGAVLAASISYAGDSLSPLVLLHPSVTTQTGWSEYAASLAGELGLYADPWDAYGRLMHEGWNAALLAVDTGLHYYGWSRQQALAVLRPYTLASDAALDSAFVALVVQAPGTAGGATIGAREYAAMRTWMQRLLGDAFDVKAWHAEVLSLGPVPLPVLAAHLEWWGWSERRKALEKTKPAPSGR